MKDLPTSKMFWYSNQPSTVPCSSLTGQSNAPDTTNTRVMHRLLMPSGSVRLTRHLSYQEMITHLGMMSHPDPRRVLVIGGGDGGVLREVVKHSSVEKAVLCDIDDVVAEVSKKYLPQMSIGYKSDKVEEHIDDGLAFVRQRKNYYDVIITDSSDPEGPARQLFEKPYFQDCYDALKDGGVIVNQGCPSYPTSTETVLDHSCG